MSELEAVGKLVDDSVSPEAFGELADPPHPLQCPWTLYYFERPAVNAPDGSYEDAIHKIGKFSTCEEFWSFYSHLVRPDELSHTISLQLFRNDSRAMWEDPENRAGGSFRLRFAKGQIGFIWEKLLLNLVGEQLPNDIIGTVVSPRAKMDLLCLWHQHGEDEGVRMEIVTALQRLLELPNKMKIDYSPFDEMLANEGQKNYVQYVLEAEGPIMKVWSKQPPQ